MDSLVKGAVVVCRHDRKLADVTDGHEVCCRRTPFSSQSEIS